MAYLRLKTITSAQDDFKANDRDGDCLKQFWRGDIAGLYALVPREGGPAIRLIERSLAAADGMPQLDVTPYQVEPYEVKGPTSGYLYRALLHADEKEPSPDRFAACAYPYSPDTGKLVFVVDENNTIYGKLGTTPVSVFPTDEELRRYWSKID